MTAILPGSFDPVTLGHIDLIRRGALLFDVIIAAVLDNPAKIPLFSVKERVDMLMTETACIPGVEVEAFSGLLAEFAKKRNVRYILRGVRTQMDAAYEIPMAQANSKLLEGLETVFLITDPAYGFMSSSLIREIAAFANNFDDKILNQWISPAVKDALKKKATSLPFIR